LYDLETHGQKFLVARGGKGGLGNSHFKSSVHQAPKIAELGEKGQVMKCRLELQLVADIGIIGFPSAGKSTLISSISNAKPKIADYPFTTLIPNLGVVNMAKFVGKNRDTFLVADIPGLIEGAHEGKGLGHEFLRHVSRTDLLIHLIDPTRNNIEDFEVINRELNKYKTSLSEKKQLIAISKADLYPDFDVDEYLSLLKKKYPALRRKKIYVISSVAGHGIKEMVTDAYKALKAIREEKHKDLLILTEEMSKEQKVFRPHLEKNKFEVVYRRSKIEAESGKTRKIFDVLGMRIEQVVKMTDFGNPDAVERVFHFMKKMGILSELRKKSASPGDRIRIAGITLIMR